MSDDSKPSERDQARSSYEEKVLSRYSREKPPALIDHFKALRLSDFSLQNLKNIPCLKSSFTLGLGIAVTMGSLRYMRTGNLRSASNWGFISSVPSFLLSWEYCRYRRTAYYGTLESIEALNSQINKDKSSNGTN